MRILLVNKFLYPKGGAETYVLGLGKLLGDKGHEVEYFGMESRDNVVGNTTGSYVSRLDFSAGILRNLHAPLRVIYNAEARRKLRRVLEGFQPDVVHLNNIQFHLTPSVILEADKYRRETGRQVKILCTAHDYQLVCPSHGLFDGGHRVCEKCLGGNYLHCVRGRCVKGSYLKSLLAAADAFFWKANRAYGCIDTILCCSAFLKSKLDVRARFREKTVLLPNFVQPPRREPVEKGDYVLQFGHLSRDKGTYTLLEAAKHMPHVRFLFAGFGEAEKAIEHVPNAVYVGFLTGSDLEMLVRRAQVTVYPSEWYENCPLSVMESISLGTPVIGTRMGGIPELIREGETGELFEAGNTAELVKKLRYLLETPGILEQYAENSKTAFFETPDSYYAKLMGIYGDTQV